MIAKLYKQLFGKQEVEALKQQELYTAQVSLLQSQSQLEYFQAMVEFNKQRIQRLQHAQAHTHHSTSVANSNHK